MKLSLPRIVADRRIYFGTPGAVLLILLVVNIFVARRERALEHARRENLLASAVLENGTGLPRFDLSVGENPGKYLPSVPDAQSSGLVLVVGMSQMYAINERRPEDLTISELLDDRLRPHNVRAFGMAAPNLNNEEALFLLLVTTAKRTTVPRFFLYGLCFDKMRNIDLRPGYLRLLRQSVAMREEVAEVAERYGTTFPQASAKLRSTLASALQDTAGATGDSTLEQRLRARTADVVPMVRARRELNQMVMYDVLYAARNKVFGITATSKRPMLSGRYELNKQLLELLIAEAKRRHVESAMYVIPLNPLADNPYIPAEYDAFKSWADQTLTRAGVAFANLESIVPREDWGVFMGGPDFKHFKGAGHRRTADALMASFGALFLSGRQGASQGSQE